MANRTSTYFPPHFVKLLKQHGMTIGNGGKHPAIFKDGSRVYTMAGTPKNMYHACDNNIKSLIKLGLLPSGIVYRGKNYNQQPLGDS